jgi:polyferredoxin
MEKDVISAFVSDTEDYRDHIATVDAEGKRIWMYPKKPSGRFYRWRTWVSLAFLAVFLTMPFIKVGGEQFLMFNVLERKFVIFGLVFTPQDFHLFVLALLTFLVFIILFTVVFGRLFCGWVCPQTVFMEMVFRKIEYWIEGDANAQQRLDKGPWNAEKIRKKGLKHLVFFSIAVVVSNYFLAYIIGMDQVLKIVIEPVSSHLGGFVAMLVFSGVFYGVYARMREQVCTTICPYGRLQSVLLVKDSIVVAYDHVRGEPRTKIKKNDLTGKTNLAPDEHNNPVSQIQQAVTYATTPDSAARNMQRAGDCIDCKLCVHVCPTGIDIRNGTQLECVNCTACIDACDAVMAKINRPIGLIRYDSMTGVETGRRHIMTPRVWAYSFVLLALIVLDVILIGSRGEVEAIILRSPGQVYQQKDANHISNLYTYTLINKTTQALPVTLQVNAPNVRIEFVGKAPEQVAKNGKVDGAFFIIIPELEIKSHKTPVKVFVMSNGDTIEEITTNFIGPN